MTSAAELASALDGRRCGQGWIARCPLADEHTHGDKGPSFTITERDGKILVRCQSRHADEQDRVIDALRVAGQWPEREREARIVATYDYRDEAGALLYQAVRMDPKKFHQRRPDGAGGWVYKLDGIRRVPYRLPELLGAPGRAAFIVEGEKDVDNLVKLGLLATTNAGGAGKWRADDYNVVLAGRDVVILPDNDEAGRKHAIEVARSLLAVAKSVRVIELPNLEPKGDVSDWLAAGGTKEQLIDLVRAAKPLTAQGLLESQPKAGRAIVTPLARIQLQILNWLWRGRFALGKVTVIVGDPGLGKSFATLDMASRVTTGRQWPDGAPACDGNVLLCTAEDDPADTVRPRLEALGADIERVHILEGITDKSSERAFNLGDAADLEAEIVRIGNVRLVIIDPISAYLGGVDSHKNSDVRALLAPFAKVAARTGVAMVCVTHLSKSAADPLNRMAGSIAFGAAARAVWLVSRDPEQPDRRLMLALKNNLAPTMDGLAFAILPNEQGDPVVAWEQGAVTITAAENMRELREQQGEKPRRETAIDDACDLLRSVLEDGPRTVIEIKEQADARGVSDATIRRARKLLGVEASRNGFGTAGGWLLRLPAPKGAQVESPSKSGGERLWQSPSLPRGSSKALNSEIERKDDPEEEGTL